MTHRLLVLGNSHLAAFKSGWDELAAQYPDVSCQFFGAPSRWSDAAVFEDGQIKITARDVAKRVRMVSGGPTSVRLADYDAFIVVGMWFGLTPCTQAFGGLHSRGVPPIADRSRLVSRECLRQIVDDVLSDSPATRWASTIAASTAKPALLVPTPFSSDPGEETAIPFLFRRRNKFKAHTERMHAIYQEVSRSVASRNGVTLMEQPPETIAFPGFSRPEYSRGSMRLVRNTPHGADDRLHMNAAYGALMFRMCIAEIERQLSAIKEAR